MLHVLVTGALSPETAGAGVGGFVLGLGLAVVVGAARGHAGRQARAEAVAQEPAGRPLLRQAHHVRLGGRAVGRRPNGVPLRAHRLRQRHVRHRQVARRQVS